MKKLFASMFVAGLLLTGVVGCSGSATTSSGKAADGDKGKVAAAQKALDSAEKALADNKDPDKKKDLEKAVADAKASLEAAKK